MIIEKGGSHKLTKPTLCILCVYNLFTLWLNKFKIFTTEVTEKKKEFHRVLRQPFFKQINDRWALLP